MERLSSLASHASLASVPVSHRKCAAAPAALESAIYCIGRLNPFLLEGRAPGIRQRPAASLVRWRRGPLHSRTAFAAGLGKDWQKGGLVWDGDGSGPPSPFQPHGGRAAGRMQPASCRDSSGGGPLTSSCEHWRIIVETARRRVSLSIVLAIAIAIAVAIAVGPAPAFASYAIPST